MILMVTKLELVVKAVLRALMQAKSRITEITERRRENGDDRSYGNNDRGNGDRGYGNDRNKDGDVIIDIINNRMIKYDRCNEL